MPDFAPGDPQDRAKYRADFNRLSTQNTTLQAQIDALKQQVATAAARGVTSGNSSNSGSATTVISGGGGDTSALSAALYTRTADPTSVAQFTPLVADGSGSVQFGPMTAANLSAIVTNQTAAYSANMGEYVRMDATGGACTVTLPSVSSVNTGQVIEVIKIDAGANAVSIAATGGQATNGTTTTTTQWKTIRCTAIVNASAAFGWDCRVI